MGWKGAPTHLKDYITEETGQAAAVQFREETHRMTGALQPDPHTWHLSSKVCPVGAVRTNQCRKANSSPTLFLFLLEVLRIDHNDLNCDRISFSCDI